MIKNVFYFQFLHEMWYFCARDNSEANYFFPMFLLKNSWTNPSDQMTKNDVIDVDPTYLVMAMKIIVSFRRSN